MCSVWGLRTKELQYCLYWKQQKWSIDLFHCLKPINNPLKVKHMLQWSERICGHEKSNMLLNFFLTIVYYSFFFSKFSALIIGDNATLKILDYCMEGIYKKLTRKS